MSINRPNVAPFERAIQRLEEALELYYSDVTNTVVRDGLIQRFEFTYELGPKVLKRYLEYASITPDQFDRMNFQDLIRTANEYGLLLGEWVDWRGFRDMRAKTSHAYDAEMSLEVIARIPRFIEEAVYLRDRLREALHD